ncbi:hypothetical protein HDU76_005854, partial [Blyttiomyces sp. JEL0837]
MYTLVVVRIRAARNIHRPMLKRLLRAPIRFFEVTPLGRIMNRFTGDMNGVDLFVGLSAGNLTSHLTAVVFTIATISFFVPVLLLAMVPIAYIYVRIGSYYIRASRSLKRITSVTKSPILSLFTETLNGATTIRSFNHNHRFETEFSHKIDDNNRSSYFQTISNSWLSIRIQAVGSLVMFFSGVFVIAAGVGPALAGLCLNLTLMLSDHLINLVKTQSSLEISMNAVERCWEYLKIEQEAEEIVEFNRPAINWPSHGKVSIQNLEMKYSADTPVVLHGISADISAGEKVGIVGRTGAGKSTLALAFFRMIEPSSGTIIIDNMDIRQMGLKDLRSHLTIIPQDPVLFAGTVRYNLDPCGETTDVDLWAALKRAHLVSAGSENGSTGGGSATIAAAENEFVINLDSAVAEGGTNLSAGQRQLLCLARALARKSRVILLDEATASVDTETDSRIQDTIRKELTHCTVLTIAHRLKTVMDYDRVIVLDHGKIIENGKPLDLIEKSSVKAFRKMCEESGEFDELLAIARRA